MASGTFRRDLLYRLSGLTIAVPPLSARLDDIPDLVQHFLSCDAIGRGLRIMPEAVHRLRQHSWPGNVRELRHVADRLTVICDTSLVTAHDISAAIGGSEMAIELSTARQAERARLVELLTNNEWNTARAAEKTGVNRTTIYRRMLRLGITPPRFQWGNSAAKFLAANSAAERESSEYEV